jgi:phenylalanyl-tRNA synthetase alpha chain
MSRCPVAAEARGGLHPVTRTLERIEALFRSIGFEVADGPEIEEDFHQFHRHEHARGSPGAFDARHLLPAGPDGTVPTRCCCAPIPARSRRATCRRTSNATVNRDAEKMPEIRIIAPGRVYRVDSDATHSPMFHQVEGPVGR